MVIKKSYRYFEKAQNEISFFPFTEKKCYSCAEIWRHVMGKDFHPGRGSYKSNSKHYAFSALLLSICEMQYLQIMRIFSVKKPL